MVSLSNHRYHEEKKEKETGPSTPLRARKTQEKGSEKEKKRRKEETEEENRICPGKSRGTHRKGEAAGFCHVL